jgi:hypothetical protein
MGVLVVCLIYFFAFLLFSTRLSDFLNSLLIDGYSSKKELFDYAEETNIEIYNYTSTDKNAVLKENIVDYGIWVIFFSSYFLAYSLGSKLSKFINKK